MTFGMRGGVLCFWDIMGRRGWSDILGWDIIGVVFGQRQIKLA